MEGDVLEDDGITAAIEELQSRLGDLQNSIDQALQVHYIITYRPPIGHLQVLTLNIICVFRREEREEEYS